MNLTASNTGCCVVQVMYGICRALVLRHNEVHVTSKRVGGGFGGKVRAR
jgi:CO/xanthine dehydrogenase Mo-binding subunit